MEKGVWIFSNPEGTFPRVLNFIHKPISTTFTNDQCDLFVDIFLQFPGIQALGLFKQLLQLLINPFDRFCKDPVKTGKNLDMDDIE
jgi:hypothetical protein